MYFEGVNFLTTGFISQRKRRRVSVKSPTGRMDFSHQASSIQCICASLTYNSFISPAVNSLHCEMDIARVTFLFWVVSSCAVSDSTLIPWCASPMTYFYCTYVELLGGKSCQKVLTVDPLPFPPTAQESASSCALANTRFISPGNIPAALVGLQHLSHLGGQFAFV